MLQVESCKLAAKSFDGKIVRRIGNLRFEISKGKIRGELTDFQIYVFTTPIIALADVANEFRDSPLRRGEDLRP
jgi:hypothetical protein